MGAHRWRSGGRRSLAGRVAIVAGLAAVGGSVLVGIGVADPGGLLPGPADGGLPGIEVLEAPSLVDLPAVADAGAPHAALPLVGTPHVAPTAPIGAPADADRQAAAAPAPASAAAEPQARSAVPVQRSGLVAGTPCTPTARACVDVVGRWAWLLDGDKIVRGPVRIQTGDREDPTPRGTFSVQWKAEQYTSREYLTPMPYSVFFAPGGIAFHQGRQDTPSAGCVKLVEQDAKAWFNYLQVGDEVQVK
ncbi:L,D-transpeptidase [Pseudonocardia acidicola]|uniref:L,D-transpeptidase n=1 Tax=Pseudonocardia acidicola TaxID=2724939 RepID=A0ABX1SCT1_9PSEU|nr:L,D-transpeptidase [Pseudonocardia acidicola]NMH99386.1 L,D-transpeptidase [Pseudonocardia acidicola]